MDLLVGLTTEQVIDNWRCEISGETPTVDKHAVDEWQITGFPPFRVDWRGKNSDILFHLHAVWDNRKIFVLNSRGGNATWGEEVQIPCYIPGTKTWTVRVDDEGFHLLVGQQKLAFFAHRLPWSQFRSVDISDQRGSAEVWGANPIDGQPCRMECDLTKHFDIDISNKISTLKDTRVTIPNTERKARKMDPPAGWYRLKQCVSSTSSNYDKGRKFCEGKRGLGGAVQETLYKRFFDDFTDPSTGLRARMTFFFLNMYAAPQSNVNSWLLMLLKRN